MDEKAHDKVKAKHLQRNAYLYVRQSTMRQVIEHQESTNRQYCAFPAGGSLWVAFGEHRGD